MNDAELEIDLPQNIIYVAGYVNGSMIIFNQDNVNQTKWKAAVPVAENNLYDVILEIHDDAGNVDTLSRSIEYILPVFIYDRTQEDVDKVYRILSAGWDSCSDEDKKKWINGLKGAFNRSDMKRIVNDINVIAKVMNVSFETDINDNPRLPTEEHFTEVLRRIQILREKRYIKNNTPQIPEMPINTFEKVNDIEHILHDIFVVFNENNIGHAIYCGNESFAGESPALL